MVHGNTVEVQQTAEEYGRRKFQTPLDKRCEKNDFTFFEHGDAVIPECSPLAKFLTRQDTIFMQFLQARLSGFRLLSDLEFRFQEIRGGLIFPPTFLGST